MPPRTFEDKPATREATPCLVGIVGPSGTGKTYSALRMATGMAKVSGGEVGLIDTEGKRALHYASKFKFRHLPFGAPFSSLDYLEAIKHFVNKGVTTIVVDSASHEHEGPGGMLEQHAIETTRMAKQFNRSEFSVQMMAWAKPKADRRRLINEILQLNCSVIFCFRAKEKLRVVPGKEPEKRGYIAIAAEELLFEFLINFLLLPGASGYPTWKSEYPEETAAMKVPEAFRDLFLEKKVQLSEDVGYALAQWSAGRPATVASKDPTKVLLEHLLAIGIGETDVAGYIGHPVDTMTADERKDLSSIGAKIKGKETSWADVVAARAAK